MTRSVRDTRFSYFVKQVPNAVVWLVVPLFISCIDLSPRITASQYFSDDFQPSTLQVLFCQPYPTILFLMAQRGGTYPPRAAEPPRACSSFRSSSSRSRSGRVDDNEKKVDGRSSRNEAHRSTDEKIDGENPAHKSHEGIAQTSPAPCDNADDQSNDEEWTIVPHPNADMRGVSSEVDLRIGWGKWRYSLLSWAVRVGVKRDQSS